MLLKRYKYDSQLRNFCFDFEQEQVLVKLQKIYDIIIETENNKIQANSANYIINSLLKLIGKDKNNKIKQTSGLYIWGGVGRGKTYLLDIFAETLPLEKKKRLHFHNFMYLIHKELRLLKSQKNPLNLLASRLSKEAIVICLDEFFVSDITDAMLLSGLLKGLFDNKVTLIITSNLHPEDLYKEGLQRSRFLPAIDLLKKNLEIINIGNGVDYRLRNLERAATYYYPISQYSERSLAEIFSNIQITSKYSDFLEIEGRYISTIRQSDGIIWFNFQEICDGPRNTTDYIEISKCFHTVIISKLPILDWQMENQARRFISLVDTLYDRGVKLVISAAVPIIEIYQGSKLKLEFQRTQSRLQEMQTHDYLERPHLPYD